MPHFYPSNPACASQEINKITAILIFTQKQNYTQSRQIKKEKERKNKNKINNKNEIKTIAMPGLFSPFKYDSYPS